MENEERHEGLPGILAKKQVLLSIQFLLSLNSNESQVQMISQSKSVTTDILKVNVSLNLTLVTRQN